MTVGDNCPAGGKRGGAEIAPMHKGINQVLRIVMARTLLAGMSTQV